MMAFDSRPSRPWPERIAFGVWGGAIPYAIGRPLDGQVPGGPTIADQISFPGTSAKLLWGWSPPLEARDLD